MPIGIDRPWLKPDEYWQERREERNFKRLPLPRERPGGRAARIWLEREQRSPIPSTWPALEDAMRRYVEPGFTLRRDLEPAARRGGDGRGINALTA
jgi:hypothetical protein